MTALAAVITVLVVANVVHKFGPANAGLLLGPVVAIALLVFARRHGLSWDDLGLGRRTWRKGAAYAVGAVVLVGVVYAVALAVPWTRAAFLDARYQMPLGPALRTALVVIPLGTVILEEVAFRGVLLGLVQRHRGMAWAAASSSILFGLWHILPSLQLVRANPAVEAAAGTATHAQLLGVLMAVGFTTLAGLLLCELRRRSGSVLASAGLHWAVNALAVLVTAVLWTA